MILLGALVVAAVVVPIWTIVTGFLRRRRRPAPATNPDQRLADAARRDAQLRQDDSRIDAARLDGRQWPL